MSTALISGKFDKVHSGHIIQIQRLGQMYDRVVVVILDYPNQRHIPPFRMNVLAEALSYSKGDYIVLSNQTHFGEITVEELEKLPKWDYYYSGNEKVLAHMSSIVDKTHVKYLSRYEGYAASKEED